MKKFIFLLLACCANAYSGPTASYALYDYDAHQFVIKEDVDRVRSMASITKLFTAMTVIRSGVNLQEKVKVTGRSRGFVPRNSMISRYDLLRAMLISSDNLASESLANAHPGGFNQFIIDANFYADQVLKLRETKIVDSSGLLPGNITNVNDLIDLLDSIKENAVIKNIAAERNAIVTMFVPQGKKQKQVTINFKNTNPQLWTFDNILISKTGFTNAAGRCVVMLVEKQNMKFAVVVLGTKNVYERSKIAKQLIEIPIEPRIVPVIEPEIKFDMGQEFNLY